MLKLNPSERWCVKLPDTYNIGEQRFSLHVMNYGSPKGPIALEAWGDEGPETRLTINLPDFKLNSGEIFTKKELLKWNKPHLEAIGFKPTGRSVNYGNFDAIAEIWKLG